MTRDEDDQVVDWLAEALGQDDQWAELARGIVILRRRIELEQQEERMVAGQETVAEPSPPADEPGGRIRAVSRWILAIAAVVDEVAAEDAPSDEPLIDLALEADRRMRAVIDVTRAARAEAGER